MPNTLIALSNLRSIRLAERLGERFERSLGIRGHELNLYAVARARAAHAALVGDP